MAEILNTIPEYYSKKNIFITGGTGFIGKMLIEQLLRTCPDVGTIYLLIRENRKMNIHERWENVKKDVLYNNVKEVNPEGLNKIKLVKGDIKELKLGISDENQKEIIEKVSIIFHVAATINFGAKLTQAIICNVRGTREICDLMLSLQKPEALCHVSTAYSQVNLEKIEEKMYFREKNWKEMIEIAENLNEDLLTIVSEKIRIGYPNTYTYTKALAELCVHDMCSEKVPASIIRPSIVIPAIQHPFKGWTDNLYAITGICIACLIGIGRDLLFIPDKEFDYVCVDVVAESMLKIAWYQQGKNKNSPTTVYNNSAKIALLTPQQMVDLTYKIIEKYPISLIYPNVTFMQSLFRFRISIVMYEFLPLLVIDFIAKKMKKKPIGVSSLRKMVREFIANRYFHNGELNYVFDLEKLDEIDEKLTKSDRELFTFDETKFDMGELMDTACNQILNHILSKLKKNKRRVQWLKCFFYAYKIVEYFILLYLLYKFIIPWFINFIYSNIITY